MTCNLIPEKITKIKGCGIKIHAFTVSHTSALLKFMVTLTTNQNKSMFFIFCHIYLQLRYVYFTNIEKSHAVETFHWQMPLYKKFVE